MNKIISTLSLDDLLIQLAEEDFSEAYWFKEEAKCTQP